MFIEQQQKQEQKRRQLGKPLRSTHIHILCHSHSGEHTHSPREMLFPQKVK